MCLQQTTPSSPNLKCIGRNSVVSRLKRGVRTPMLRALHEREIRVVTIHEHGHTVLFLASYGPFESLAHHRGLSKFTRAKMLATSKSLFDLLAFKTETQWPRIGRDCHICANRRFAHSQPQNFGPQVTGT
ncbi:hypothetical protein BDR05DRAFT_957484 [Suillus weaverae]|nr:hypothetical protein BDR05DRAFT_957484 [Suillus weaverae]